MFVVGLLLVTENSLQLLGVAPVGHQPAFHILRLDADNAAIMARSSYFRRRLVDDRGEGKQFTLLGGEASDEHLVSRPRHKMQHGILAVALHIRKVTQAAGRVVRSKSDQGTLFLIDDRYAQSQVQALLPAWWRIGAVSEVLE